MKHNMKLMGILVTVSLFLWLVVLPARAWSASSIQSNHPAVINDSTGQEAARAETPTDQLIIQYKLTVTAFGNFNPSSADRIQRLSNTAGVALTYAREMSGQAHVLRLPARTPLKDVQAIAKRLETLPEVEYAEPDAMMQHTLIPDDPQYTNQWHYFAPSAGNYGIDAPAAWDITTGSASVVVAVLDTGITAHVEFAGRTVPGYDFIADSPTANDGDGRDSDPSDPGDWITAAEDSSGHFAGCGVSDSSWHGTHTAGTIGAASNNNTGVAGINWNSMILPVRVLGKCGGYTSDIVDGMRWAAGLAVSGVPSNPNPAKVINISLGGPGACDAASQSAIDAVTAAGTTVVVSAGNSDADASGFSPANCNGVITVAATDRDGSRAYYSNFGNSVEISAPGGAQGYANDPNGVLSTLNTGTQGPVADTYIYYQGTSMAAPHVTGVVSLLYSINPLLTPGQVLTILQNTVTSFPAGSTCNNSDCGSGIVNAGAAVAYASGVATSTPTTTPTVTATPVGGCNAAAITINDDTAASPYPSNITITGLGTSITDVNVQLIGLTHDWPEDIDMLLVGPQGQNLIILSDAGSQDAINHINLTLDDSAVQVLPSDTALASGVYRPANYEIVDTFPAPAPAPSTETSLATFNGTNPNGTWSLYVLDDAAGDAGSLSGGWCLGVVASNSATSTPTGTSTSTSTPTSTGTATATVTSTPTGPTPTPRSTQTATSTGTPLTPGILRVVPNGITSGVCGTLVDWSNACDMQYALSSALANNELWVKMGLYTPTTGADRSATFQLKNDVAVYGGFAGTETEREQRDPAVNITILSGDIDHNDNQTPIITNIATVTGNTTNSYHVVTGATGAILDGFTITAGYTSGAATNYSGGGMYNDASSPALMNVTFSGNSASWSGGGMFNSSSSPMLTDVTFSSNSAGSGGGMYNVGSSPMMTNVTFNGNHAGWYGGGMYTSGGSPTLTSVTFNNNSANEVSNDYGLGGGGMYNDGSNLTMTNVTLSGNKADYGGGMYNDGGHPTMTNVTFRSNSATLTGGGMHNSSSNPTLTNATFNDNSASISGSGMENVGSSSPIIRNTIFWGNHYNNVESPIFNLGGTPILSDSIVQGGCPAGSTCTNIIMTDPKLGPLGEYGGSTKTIPLLPGSSAIDTGNDADCPATDQRSVARPQGAHCDIGAYEDDGTVIDYLYYVKPAASGTGDCSSWSNACLLQTALNTSVYGNEIWTAAGTHKPTTGTDRAATFQLKNGVAIYGGFAGTETACDQRDPAANISILSGDLNGDDDGFNNNAENAFHVVTGAAGATLDGFTITAGNANGASPDNSGGGMYNSSDSPTLMNVTFSGNSAGIGGGMSNNSSSPILMYISFSGNQANAGGGMFNSGCRSPILINITFSGNTATNRGGGMANSASSECSDSINPFLMNVTFNNNSAGFGGGMSNDTSDPMLVNVTFSGNSATDTGGGMYNEYSSTILTNVTFSGNSATNTGGGMENHITSYPIIDNTIFWGNTAPGGGGQIHNNNQDDFPILNSHPTLRYNVVQDGCQWGSTCTNLITTDPLLGALGNYGGSTQTIPLLPGSSAIDAGNDATCAVADQRGVARPQGARCDIGAFELDATAPIIISITRINPSPTILASVSFTVTFSEVVTGVDASDFNLTTTGVSSASVTGVSGAGSVYTVTVSTGSGNGTLRLDVPNSATITDLDGNPLASLPYTGGETYMIIKVFPIFLPFILG